MSQHVKKPNQNNPPVPTFSIPDYTTIMKWKRKKDTKLLWKFKLSFLIQLQETTVWI